jgi:hypothetical protein
MLSLLAGECLGVAGLARMLLARMCLAVARHLAQYAQFMVHVLGAIMTEEGDGRSIAAENPADLLPKC